MRNLVSHTKSGCPFDIIRTFEKSEPLTNIPLCRRNYIFKGSDFILGVLCFVKKRRRVIKYG